MSGPYNYPDFEKTRVSLHNESIETSEFYTSPNLVGTTFEGRFRVDAFLGAGGSGQVYRCTDLPMQRPVALKILSSQLDAKTVRRFQTEAMAISRLNHSNLISIHDFGLSQSGQPFIVMEFIEGQSLADLLKKEVRLTPARCIDLFVPVFDALQAMHDKSVIHRDLKPGNIIVSNTAGKQIAKVVDFGIAKILSESADGQPQLTQTGEIFGSPLYMSPEQACGTKVDPRTDQYSLGCMIFECLTGTTPHVGKSSIETLLKHQSEPVPTLREASMGEKFSPGLEAVIAKLLSKDPEARYASMSEAKLAFAHSLTAKPEGAPSIAVASKGINKSMIAVAAAVVLLIIVISFITFAFNQPEKRASIPDTPRPQAEELQAFPAVQMAQSNMDFQEFLRKNPRAVDLRVNPDESDERVAREPYLVFNKNITDPAMVFFDDLHFVKRLFILNCDLLTDKALLHITHLPLEEAGFTLTPVGNETTKNLLKIKSLKILDLKLTKVKDAAFEEPSTNLEALILTNTAVGNDCVTYLAKYTKLSSVCLDGTKIEGDCLKPLIKLPLVKLNISRTRVTDDVADSIGSMKKLIALEISSTKLTDKFLQNLQNLTNLKSLKMKNCQKITPSGLAAFRRQHPSCQIDDTSEKHRLGIDL